ncbi:kelch repeat [Pelomyxa schiedti]|nr:kelch repeat [Pelomyxa schiedti]
MLGSPEIVIEHSIQWELLGLTKQPPGRCWQSSCLVHDRYVFMSGGYSGYSYYDDLCIFDCEKRAWIYFMNNMIRPRYAHTTSAIGDYVYIVAGAHERNYLRGVIAFPADVTLYVPDSKPPHTTVSSEGPTARAAHMVAVVGANIYCFGGDAGKGNYFNELHTFNTESHEWTKINATGDIPSPRAWGTLSSVGSKLYLICGTNGSIVFNDVYVFDTTTKEWHKPTTLGEKPTGRHSHSAAVHGTNVYVFGGSGDGKFQSFSDVLVFCTQTNTWYNATAVEPPAPRYGHSAFFYGKTMFVFGGCIVNKSNSTRSFSDEVVAITPFTIPRLPSLPGTLSQDLRTLLNNKAMFPDIVFLVEGGQVCAHKAILAARSSDYFRTMFCGPCLEHFASEITIENVSKKAFLRVLEFIYTGKLERLEEEDISDNLELLEVAQMYNMQQLVRICEQVLLSRVHVATDVMVVLQVIHSAFTLCRKSLQVVCLNWLASYPDPVAESALAELSPEEKELVCKHLPAFSAMAPSSPSQTTTTSPSTSQSQQPQSPASLSTQVQSKPTAPITTPTPTPAPTTQSQSQTKPGTDKNGSG